MKTIIPHKYELKLLNKKINVTVKNNIIDFY